MLFLLKLMKCRHHFPLLLELPHATLYKSPICFWPYMVFIRICLKQKNHDKVLIFLRSSDKFKIEWQTYGGRSTNIFNSMQISGKTQRISFDEGIFCSLIDSDTRFQQNLTDLLGCWYILQPDDGKTTTGGMLTNLYGFIQNFNKKIWVSTIKKWQVYRLRPGWTQEGTICSGFTALSSESICLHISPAFLEISVIEIPGFSSLICPRWSFNQRKQADWARLGWLGSFSFLLPLFRRVAPFSFSGFSRFTFSCDMTGGQNDGNHFSCIEGWEIPQRLVARISNTYITMFTLFGGTKLVMFIRQAYIKKIYI